MHSDESNNLHKYDKVGYRETLVHKRLKYEKGFDYRLSRVLKLKVAYIIWSELSLV